MQLVLQILHKSMAPFGSYDFFFDRGSTHYTDDMNIFFLAD